MRKLTPAGTHGEMLQQPPPDCEIIVDRLIFDYILYELKRYPISEEGGKYIGYIEPADNHEGDNRKHRIFITDFLPGGPNAKRTAVEFLPDGEFQERLFRKAETRDRNVEHIGSWHSHHCNGLNHLSRGDIEGYFKTVNKSAYRPSVFIASLVKYLPRAPRDTDWIDHFLFVRHQDCFYKITSHITITDLQNKFGDITGHYVAQEQGEAQGLLWYETPVGKKILADDKRFFGDRFGESVRATRRGGVITLACSIGSKVIAISYPEACEDRQVKINIGSASHTTLTITCDYSVRNVAYATSLNALEHF